MKNIGKKYLSSFGFQRVACLEFTPQLGIGKKKKAKLFDSRRLNHLVNIKNIKMHDSKIHMLFSHCHQLTSQYKAPDIYLSGFWGNVGRVLPAKKSGALSWVFLSALAPSPHLLSLSN